MQIKKDDMIHYLDLQHGSLVTGMAKARGLQHQLEAARVRDLENGDVLWAMMHDKEVGQLKAEADALSLSAAGIEVLAYYIFGDHDTVQWTFNRSTGKETDDDSSQEG
jgi:hypothetical protein